MKTFAKKFSAISLALLLTVLLILPAISFATAAETPTPVLSVDFRGDAHYTPVTMKGTFTATPSADGRSCTIAMPSETENAYFGAATDLPLKGSNKIYTIDFSVTRQGNLDTPFGFYIDANAGKTDGINGFYGYNNGTIDFFQYGTGQTNYRSFVGLKYTNSYTNYYRVIVDTVNNRMTFSALMNTDRWANLFTRTGITFNTDNLWLIFRYYNNRPGKTFIVNNVNVYEGLLTEGTAVSSAEHEGERLLALGDLSQPAAGTNGATYTPGISDNNGNTPTTYQYNAETGVSAKIIGAKAGGSTSVTTYGGTTNLRLDGNTQYTIHYQMKLNGTGGTALRFCYPSIYSSTGLYINNNGTNACIAYANETGADGVYPYTNFTEAMKVDGSIYTHDGFSDIAVELDGYQVTVYINGVQLLSYSALTPSKNTIPTGFTTDTLTIVLQDYIGAITEGLTQCEYRNIEVWSGLTARNTWLTVTDGETTVKNNEKVTSADGYVLPAPAPAVRQLFKGWMVNGNAEKLMNSGETVKLTGKQATVAAVYATSQADVWVQFKDNGNGTEDMRIVGVLDSLDYSEIGYKVSITYNEKNHTEDHSLKCVYNALTAKYGEEIVTTETLGFAGEGYYLTALTIKNIPTAGTISVQLTPYYTLPDSSEKVFLNSSVTTLTLVNGELSK